MNSVIITFRTIQIIALIGMVLVAGNQEILPSWVTLFFIVGNALLAIVMQKEIDLEVEMQEDIDLEKEDAE